MSTKSLPLLLSFPSDVVEAVAKPKGQNRCRPWAEPAVKNPRRPFVFEEASFQTVIYEARDEVKHAARGDSSGSCLGGFHDYSMRFLRGLPTENTPDCFRTLQRSPQYFPTIRTHRNRQTNLCGVASKVLWDHCCFCFSCCPQTKPLSLL